MSDAVWCARMAEALANGFPTRRLENKKRRALEKISCEMVRCAHRAIYQNAHGRVNEAYAQPAPTADD